MTSRQSDPSSASAQFLSGANPLSSASPSRPESQNTSTPSGSNTNPPSGPFLVPPPSVSVSHSSSTGSDEVSTMFPAPNSHQRVGASKYSITPVARNSLNAPPSSAGSLLVPKSAAAAARARSKVALAPGHSPLDWAKLNNSGKNLRGIDSPMPITVTTEELKKHNTPEDTWMVIDGKVFNVTPYIPFHPGGDKILKAVAGKDATKLFMKTHAWVSYDNILKNTFVGIYRP